jgi:Cu(I)/Ag(I) efflux system membrane fusion protein
LMAGDNSVVYVETEPGRFEIRRVVLGARSGDQIVVLKGLEDGEEVAVSGYFLIDSQMQLTGNPSLIDPTRLEPSVEIEFAEGSLPPIGEPRIVIEEADVTQQLAPPPLGGATDQSRSDEENDALYELSPEDQRLAERQKVCPVADMPLGSMGIPVKVLVEGRTVFLCCEGCRERLLAEPDKYLAKLTEEAVR